MTKQIVVMVSVKVVKHQELAQQIVAIPIPVLKKSLRVGLFGDWGFCSSITLSSQRRLTLLNLDYEVRAAKVATTGRFYTCIYERAKLFFSAVGLEPLLVLLLNLLSKRI